MRYVIAWLLVIAAAIVGWQVSSRAFGAEALDCEQEVLAWCKTYPGPADVDCEKMAREECTHKPPPYAELCKMRAKRMCTDQQVVEERESCYVARLLECKSP